MPRRLRTIVLSLAAVLLVIAALAGGIAVWFLRTDSGHEFLRARAEAFLGGLIKGRGRLHVGRVGGDLLTGITIDSIEVRDADDSLVVRTGPIGAHYNIGDFLDKRYVLTDLSIQRPVVNLRQHADFSWAFLRMLRGDTVAHLGSARPLVRADKVTMHGATVILTMPWEPAPWHTGRQRDSVITTMIAAGEIAHTSEGLKRSWRWTKLDLDGTALHASDPKAAGGSMDVAHLRADETFPPVTIREAKGQVKWFPDSVFFNLARVEFPASRGRARGAVRWKPNVPLQLDIRATGEYIALADLWWIYPTLPKEGGGRVDLHVRTDPREPQIIEYVLTNLDARSGASRLLGKFTVGVGGEQVRFTDLALGASPVTTKLLEAVLAAPLALKLDGDFRGIVNGPGGTLDKFVLSDVRATYTDARVANGVPVVLRASGGLDFAARGHTAFRAFHVALSDLTPAVIRAVEPGAAKLPGTFAGDGVLTSAGPDSLIVRELTLAYTDSGGAPTQLTGNAVFVRGATGFERYDADLVASPLQVGALARAWPKIPVRGEFSGPLHITGDSRAARVLAELQGSAGEVTADATFEFASPFGVHGTVTTRGLAVDVMGDKDGAPTSRVAAALRMDVHGDSLAVLEGTISAELGGSTFGGLDVTQGTVKLGFAAGRMTVDSLRVVSTVGTVIGTGAIGLRDGVPDSVHLVVAVDSLAALRTGLRPLIGAARIAQSTSTLGVMLWGDTLRGRLAADAWVTGRVDSMHVTGEARLVSLRIGVARADTVAAAYDVRAIPTDPRGTLDIRVERGRWDKQRLDRAHATIELTGAQSATVALTASASRGFDRVATLARVERHGDTTLVLLDSLATMLGPDSLRLAEPTRVTIDAASITLDTLRATSGTRGHLTAAGRIADAGPVQGMLLVEDMPYAVQDSALEVPPRAWALLNARIGLTGTKRAPKFDILVDADSLRLAGAAAGALRVTGDYANRRLTVTARLDEGTDGDAIFAGDIPVDLSLAPVERRLLKDSLVGTLRADSLKLTALRRLFPQVVSDAGGKLRMQFDVTGTIERPHFDGRVQVDAGTLVMQDVGLQLHGLVADVALSHDSIVVRDFRASGDPHRVGDSVTVGGYAWLPDSGPGAIDFTIRAQGFGAFRKRATASFDATGLLHLAGTRDDLTLDGDLVVFNGIGFLGTRFVREAAISRIQTETRADSSEEGFEPPPPTFFERLKQRVVIGNLGLRLGDNVRLVSADANMLLGGSVTVTGALDAISLSGDLVATRGIYRLNLGVVTRTFQVDSGRVSFFGPLANSPGIDITTTYLVRQQQGIDQRIHARILGTVDEPRVELSSDDQSTTGASDTELISYLIFGVPSFALVGPNASTLRTVSNALAPTLGGVAEQALSAALPGVDMVRVTMASQGDDLGGSADPLSSSSISAGKQLNEQVFISVNTGLCRGGSAGTGGDLTPWVGLSVEYRLAPTSWIAASMDPGTATCTRSLISVAPALQFGLDIFREWRFR